MKEKQSKTLLHMKNYILKFLYIYYNSGYLLLFRIFIINLYIYYFSVNDDLSFVDVGHYVNSSKSNNEQIVAHLTILFLSILPL